jgi:hypothetical protein
MQTQPKRRLGHPASIVAPWRRKTTSGVKYVQTFRGSEPGKFFLIPTT